MIPHDDPAYQKAWRDIERGIRDGWGELADHLSDARAFVGDEELLALLDNFDPGEVLIACGIELIACVLDADFKREMGARLDDDREPVTLAVRSAHTRLVRSEGDTKWRRILPADVKEIAMRQLREMKARDDPRRI